jgi:hypothetical protein
LLTALLAQTAPPDAPAAQLTFEQERAAHKLQVEQEYAPLPSRGATSISKVIRMAVEEGHLHVKPLFETTAGAVRVEATDWPGYLQVTVGDPKRLAFHLKHIDLRDPKLLTMYTEVMTGPDYLQISRESEGHQIATSITLIQSRQFADENEQPIRLTVRRTNEAAETPEIDLKFSGESFDTLRQQHPREFRTYLLPILRDLGAAELINSSTPTLAWQVLGDAIEVEPQMQAKLKRITERLNAEDFKQRVAAEDELATLGPDAAVALRRTDSSALPPDPATALRQFRQKREPLTPQRAAELGKDVQFLLDTLLLDDPRLRRAAAAKLQSVMGTTIDLPDDLPAAERAKRVEKLRDRFVPSTQPGQ